jgi:hypothetical protein
MKILAGLALAAGVAIMLTAASATAHNLVVTNPSSGEEVNQQWVGGPLLPSQAEGQGLAPHPLGKQPAGHSQGLPHACHNTASSPAVSILAPPFFTGCVHGQP